MLAEVIKQKTGAKVRGIELSLLQRCGAHLASHTDIEEAKMAGRVAVEAAVEASRKVPRTEVEPMEFSIVRKENMYDPANQKLLFPVTR